MKIQWTILDVFPSVYTEMDSNRYISSLFNQVCGRKRRTNFIQYVIDNVKSCVYFYFVPQSIALTISLLCCSTSNMILSDSGKCFTISWRTDIYIYHMLTTLKSIPWCFTNIPPFQYYTIYWFSVTFSFHYFLFPLH